MYACGKGKDGSLAVGEPGLDGDGLLLLAPGTDGGAHNSILIQLNQLGFLFFVEFPLNCFSFFNP